MTSTDYPATHLTSKFTEAVAYASALHATQIRKGTAVPYIAHLLGVASLVLEAEGDEDMVIGGLLHDAAEDHGGEARLRDIEARFGDAVAHYVHACSDYLGDDPSAKPPWRPRKENYLTRLRADGVNTVTVSMADKVHNARSIITDLHNGIWVFDKFKVEPDDTIWYYQSCLKIGQDKGVSRALVTPLERAVQAMRDEAATWSESNGG